MNTLSFTDEQVLALHTAVIDRLDEMDGDDCHTAEEDIFYDHLEEIRDSVQPIVDQKIVVAKG